MIMARGFGLTRIPAGAYGADYRPGNRGYRQEAARLREEHLRPIKAAEAKAKNDQFLRDHAVGWGVAPEDVDLFVSDPEAYRAEMERRAAAARSDAKVQDFYARVAVEGDTDLNHDNVEEGQ